MEERVLNPAGLGWARRAGLGSVAPCPFVAFCWPLPVLLALGLVGCGPQWQAVGIGGGGGIFVPVSSPHDPSLMFCASDMSGVYRSTDGGRTWRMLPWGQLSRCISCAIAFDPSDPNVLYAVPGPWAETVLKVSRDRGLTWKPLCQARPWRDAGGVGRVSVGPDGQVILVSAEKGTFRTDDGGRTWTRVKGIDTYIHRVFFAPPAAGGEWFVGTPTGVYVSGDWGRTWRPTGKIPGERLHDFCGGADAQLGKVVLYCSVPGRDEDGKFAGGIYRSDDRGRTWVRAMGPGINTTIGRHMPVTRSVPDYPFLGMATNQTDTVYAFGYGTGLLPPYSTTVYRTDDRGRSWRRVLNGPRGLAGQNVELGWLNYDRGWNPRPLSFSVNERHKDVVHFSTAMELFVTYDGGRRWRQAYTRCADLRPGRGKRWTSVGLEVTTTWWFRFDPHDPNRAYICYTDIGFARSRDRGRSWTYSVAGCPWSNTFYDIAFDPDRPGVIYAACAYQHDIPSWKMAGTVAGGGGVCISTNWGRTWVARARGLPARGACTAVELDPNSPANSRTLYAAIYGGGVFKSTDSGASWRAVNAGLRTARNDHFTDLKLHADGTLFALCGPKKDPKTNLPVAYGGLFKSTDGGRTWTDLIAQLKLHHPYGFDVDPTDSRIIYLCAAAVPRHHREDGVYRSTDGGATWRKLKIDWPVKGRSYVHPKFPSVDPYRPERVWISVGACGLMVSTDRGETWRQVKGLPFRGPNRVTVDPRDHETIWVSTFGGGIWRGPAMGTGR